MLWRWGNRREKDDGRLLRVLRWSALWPHLRNNFYIKVTEPGKAVLKEVTLRPPYDGAKDYFYISDVDDRDYLTTLIKATIPALPKPKAKKNPLK